MSKLMTEKEYEGILAREDAVKNVNEIYSHQIALLKDITNYGTNLISRVFTTGERGLSETIVVGVLLKQVVAMLDGAEILINQGAIFSAHLEVRAAYEASIYIDWILDSEKEKKTKYYYVSNLRNERIWALRLIEGTEERERFSSGREELDFDILKDKPELEDESKKRLQQINEFLAQKEFKDIDKHFDELKSKDRFKREPIWYKPLGMNSIRQIARYVKRLSEYDIFYGKGSEVTHSSSYKDHIIMRKGEILFKDIRNLEDCHTLINFLVSIVFKTYRSILNYYRPGEIQNFNRKYVENWREVFRTIRQVTYKYPEDKKTII